MRTKRNILEPAMMFYAATACAVNGSAAVIGTSVAALPLTEERIAALPRAQQSVWRDYLARSVKQMQADRAVLQSEMKAAGLTEELVPPSSSSAKSIPLDKPADWYGGNEARRIADIIVSFQTPAGGWSKNIDLSQHARRPGESFAPNNLSAHPAPGDFDTPHDLAWNYVGTLDNDATTAELQFLARVIVAAPASGNAYRAAFLRGMEYLFAAQYPNGGWPQIWPLQGGYHDAITFNDGAVIQVLELLQDVGTGKDSFAFVPEGVRAKARASVAKGIECMLAAQIVVKGQRTVWAQQHDTLNLQPVAARNYEPAAQCASESAALIAFLMRLPSPTEAEVTAVYAAADWLQKTAIQGKSFVRVGDGRTLVAAPGAAQIWARFYEIGSDRPVFGDRDKTIHDDVNEISLERRNGYSWYNAGPQASLDLFAKWSTTHARTKVAR
jgi:PelA/Pel-15E family pectate lyase